MSKKLLTIVSVALTAVPVVKTEADQVQVITVSDTAKERYICLKYGNCGQCNGKCNLKNPDTPGLTPEEKKIAEAYKKAHPNEKGSLCGAAGSGNFDAGNVLSSNMHLKRVRLQSNQSTS